MNDSSPNEAYAGQVLTDHQHDERARSALAVAEDCIRFHAWDEAAAMAAIATAHATMAGLRRPR